MSSTPTAKERAEKRWPKSNVSYFSDEGSLEEWDDRMRRDGFATRIREEVEPLEAKLAEKSKALESLSGTLSEYREEIDQQKFEVSKLRALVQTLVDALDRADALIVPVGSCKVMNAISSAASQGFTPTNTTEG